MLDNAVAAFVALMLVAIGVCIGYWIWGSEVTTVREDYAPAIDMPDGSKVLSREPDGKVETPAPKRPSGHKVIRTVEVTVQGGKPKPVEPRRIADTFQPQGCVQLDDLTCPAVTVRVDLLRAPDGTLRAQASSADGMVLDGVDIPREPTLLQVRRPWAVGYEQDTAGRRGAFAQRDVGRLVLGVSVTGSEADGAAIAGRVGVRF